MEDTGENVSSKSIPRCCRKPCSTSLSLCLIGFPVSSVFTLNTHRQPMTFLSVGRSDNVHVILKLLLESLVHTLSCSRIRLRILLAGRIGVVGGAGPIICKEMALLLV